MENASPEASFPVIDKSSLDFEELDVPPSGCAMAIGGLKPLAMGGSGSQPKWSLLALLLGWKSNS
jgi:hypothetical protein